MKRVAKPEPEVSRVDDKEAETETTPTTTEGANPEPAPGPQEQPRGLRLAVTMDATGRCDFQCDAVDATTVEAMFAGGLAAFRLQFQARQTRMVIDQFIKKAAEAQGQGSRVVKPFVPAGLVRP